MVDQTDFCLIWQGKQGGMKAAVLAWHISACGEQKGCGEKAAFLELSELAAKPVLDSQNSPFRP
jgi:hypothetical protein